MGEPHIDCLYCDANRTAEYQWTTYSGKDIYLCSCCARQFTVNGARIPGVSHS